MLSCIFEIYQLQGAYVRIFDKLRFPQHYSQGTVERLNTLNKLKLFLG